MSVVGNVYGIPTLGGMFMGRGLRNSTAFSGRPQLDVAIDGTSLTINAQNQLTVNASTIVTGGTGLTTVGNTLSVDPDQSQVTRVGVLESLTVNGQSTLKGGLDVFNNRITNVTTPTSASDAANKSYVDGLALSAGTGLTNTGGVLSVNNSLPNVQSIGSANVDINIYGWLKSTGSDNAVGGGSLQFQKNRAGAAVQSNDELGWIGGYGQATNGTYQRGAYMIMRANAAPGSNYVPGNMQFFTTNGAGVQALRLHLSDAGINVNNHKILNLANPTVATDAATKAYVDSMASGVKPQEAVRVASTANLTLTAPGAAIDGVTLSNGDRVLVKNQTTASQNGAYVFNGAASAMTRTTEMATSVAASRFYYFVSEGSTQAGRSYVCSSASGSDVVGTNNLTFDIWSISPTYTMGTGLTNTGGTLSVNASQTQITQVGTLTALDLSGALTSSNSIVTTDATNATSTTTGSLQTAGGLGVVKDVVVGGVIRLGNVANSPQRVQLGGGNSYGNLFTSLTLAEGVHLAYNYYHNGTSGVMPNASQATSRIRVSHGNIQFYTGGANVAPTIEHFRITDTIGVQTYTPFLSENTTRVPTNWGSAGTPAVANRLKGDLFFGGTAPQIMFKRDDAAQGPPTTTNRSVGTKIVLRPAISGTDTDYAIGYEDVHMWFSTSGWETSGFKFYHKTTEILRISNEAGLDVKNKKIINVATPTLATDVATKGYVDGTTGVTAGAGLTNTGGTLAVNSQLNHVSQIGTDNNTVTFPGAVVTGDGITVGHTYQTKIRMEEPGQNNYYIIGAKKDDPAGDFHIYDNTGYKPIFQYKRTRNMVSFGQSDLLTPGRYYSLTRDQFFAHTANNFNVNTNLSTSVFHSTVGGCTIVHSNNLFIFYSNSGLVEFNGTGVFTVSATISYDKAPTGNNVMGRISFLLLNNVGAEKPIHEQPFLNDVRLGDHLPVVDGENRRYHTCSGVFYVTAGEQGFLRIEGFNGVSSVAGSLKIAPLNLQSTPL